MYSLTKNLKDYETKNEDVQKDNEKLKNVVESSAKDLTNLEDLKTQNIQQIRDMDNSLKKLKLENIENINLINEKDRKIVQLESEIKKKDVENLNILNRLHTLENETKNYNYFMVKGTCRPTKTWGCGK
jgi:chromosome segregation ATPase